MKLSNQKKPVKSIIKQLQSLHRQKDFVGLEEASRKYLDYYENNPEIQNFLGAALSGQELYQDAFVYFFKAVVDSESSFSKSRYLSNIGVSYLKLDDQKNALNYLSKAVTEDEENVNALFNQANAMRNLGQVEQSLEVYQKALNLDPKHANSVMFYSLALKVLGRFEDSKKSAFKALSLSPQWGMAHRHLSSMIDYSKDKNHLVQMESLIKGDDLSDENKMNLCFAISKALEEIGNYKDSFNYLSKGNNLARKGVEFSTEHSNNYFRLMKKAFSKEFFESAETHNSLGQGIIFVLGMPRSGTSLVEQILASHSKVFGAGELRHYRRCIDKFYFEIEGKKFPKNFRSHSLDSVDEVGKHYEEMISDIRGDSPFFVDKMPYNFMYIPLIKLSLPKSRIVLCERNPLDNCLSIYKQKFGVGNAYAYSLEELGNYYNSYKEITDQWKSLLGDQLFCLNYEGLTKNQKEVTENMLDYCSLEWEESCLDFHKTNRNNKTASSVQVRRPIYTSSIKLAEKYEEELEPLFKILNSEEKSYED